MDRVGGWDCGVKAGMERRGLRAVGEFYTWYSSTSDFRFSFVAIVDSSTKENLE